MKQAETEWKMCQKMLAQGPHRPTYLGSPIAAALMMLAEAAISGDPAIQRRIDRAPKPVHEFIERRAGCNYFASEYPYSKVRELDLLSKARSFRCTALERDERALRRLFARRLDTLDLLAKTQDVIY